MNVKLLSGFRFIILALVSSVPSALAEEQMHSCPDMSEHERVLNEGINVHKQHAVPNLHSWPLDRIPYSIVNDYTPSRREYDLRNSLRWLEGSIESLPLNSLSHRQTAEGYAEQFEELGMYAPAQKLYERLVAAKQADKEVDQYELIRSTKSLERVKLCQSAHELRIKRNHSAAIEDLGKVVENISTSDMSLPTKASLLKKVKADINQTVEEQGTRSGLTAEEVINSQKTKARAEELSTNWKRELECLGMAQKLDRTAWSLERDGQLPMAEKLYKQALQIKQKNLGFDDPETLAQNADLARLSAASGHKAEACKYYEEALKALRKPPNQGRTYASMLESYGDLLDRMHEKTRAEKIYEEARNYYEKTGTTRN